MTIEEILSDWRKRSVQYAPKVWAGHYAFDVPEDGEQRLSHHLVGEMTMPQRHHVDVMAALIPFAISSDVDFSAVVVDWDTEVWTLRMIYDGVGVRSTYWMARPDESHWAFVAEKRPWTLGNIPEGLGPIIDRKCRNSDHYTYEAAVLAVSNLYPEWTH